MLAARLVIIRKFFCFQCVQEQSAGHRRILLMFVIISIERKCMFKIPEEHLQTIRRFCLFDDTYMNCYFKDFREGAEFLAQMILDVPDLRVDKAEIQEVLPNMTSRSPRLDVFAKDQKGNQYDIEFQTEINLDLIKRSRFYSSDLDVNLLKKGKDYSQLVESYIIFLCRGDVIGKNLPMHHFTMKDEHGNELADGRHIIFINADYPGDWRLKKLMEDLKQPDPQKMHYPILRKRAEYFKEMEDGIMYLNEDMQNLIDKSNQKANAEVKIAFEKMRKAEAEAKKYQKENLELEAKAKKLQEEKLTAEANLREEVVREMLRENMPVDVISRIAHRPKEEIIKIQNKMDADRAVSA